MRIASLQIAGLIALTVTNGCASDIGDAEDTLEANEQALASHVPVIPQELTVPEGNRLRFVLFAEGVQIYDCKVVAEAAPAWVFRAPEAELFGLFGWPAGKHYAGPTWEGLDGSKVVGKRVAGASVDASAIPWLLLEASAHEGSGRLSKVTYLQRLFTRGGNAPATGCDADHVAAVAEVDYTALYAFYGAKTQQ